jgi:hypothetical protein
MQRLVSAAGFLAAGSVVAAFAIACGSRTGLFGDSELVGTTPQPQPQVEAGRTDAALDAGARRDVAPDVDPDPFGEDASPDAFCADGGGTTVYVVSAEDDLYAFHPLDLSFRRIGTLKCPADGGTPHSMAVSRSGVAYVEYGNGPLFRVSTRTAACLPTSFAANQLGFQSFGMGFAADEDAATESLYVVDPYGGFSIDDASRPSRLGVIDVNTFVLREVGPLDPSITRGELSGTPDGRLFLYDPHRSNEPGGTLSLINTATAALVSQDVIPTSIARAYAFAFWGGEFWLFTSESGQGDSVVSRYNPITKVLSKATVFDGTIVGAGVSTCAPP